MEASPVAAEGLLQRLTKAADEVRHLVPLNALRKLHKTRAKLSPAIVVTISPGATLTFASFASRDRAHAALLRHLAPSLPHLAAPPFISPHLAVAPFQKIPSTIESF